MTVTTVMTTALLLVMSLPAVADNDHGGGNVLPGNADPHGYSLDDMAKLMALFNTSGNDPQYYPRTPFQILGSPFANPNNPTVTPRNCSQPQGTSGILVTGGNTFVVKTGTPFFVPIASYDDSPIVLGVFPNHKSQVADYVFGPNGFGARNYQIIVDGDRTPIGPQYLSEPVHTPPLLDGGGRHLIQLGAFLTPMSVGTHTVHFSGEIGTPTFFQTYGIGCVAADFTYTVKVVAGH